MTSADPGASAPTPTGTTPTGTTPTGTTPTGAAPQLAELEAIIGSIDRDARAAARQRADSDERRAVEARAGRIGPDWQVVQRRIDSGQTTVEDVFAGRDETPEARRLLARSQRNLAELGQLMREDDRTRDELDELDQELSAWDAPDVVPEPDAEGALVTEPTGIRSATDPIAGADGGPSAAGTGVGGGRPGSRAAPAPEPRDPVADRVDATGLEPPADDDGERS